MTHPSSTPDTRHRVVREGFIAGILGATTVAAWFLFVDLVGGQPLRTPSVLGASLMNALGWEPFLGTFGTVLFYTVFHYAAFVGIGILAVVGVHASLAEASLLVGLLILFVAFQVGFYVFIYLLDLSLLGTIAWTQIGIANVLASVVMGRFLWRGHPRLHGRVAEGLSGRGTT